MTGRLKEAQCTYQSDSTHEKGEGTASENECAKGLWGEVLIKGGQGAGVGWASVPDAGGAMPTWPVHVFPLQIGIWGVSPTTGNQGAGSSPGNRWSVKVMSGMPQPKQRRGELPREALLSVRTVLPRKP